MSRHFPFLAALAFLLAVLSFTIVSNERVVAQGDRIILETRPIDPRDLFRGEYVILRYAIEDDMNVRGDASWREPGSKLLVGLSPDRRGVGQVICVKEKASPEVATLIPQNECLGLDGPIIWLEGEVWAGAEGVNVLRFPSLEQFYVPEGAGPVIERMREGLHVEVLVKDGSARAVQLLDSDLRPLPIADYARER
jgi:uncharacterized membrane-anchored protein